MPLTINILVVLVVPICLQLRMSRTLASISWKLYASVSCWPNRMIELMHRVASENLQHPIPFLFWVYGPCPGLVW